MPAPSPLPPQAGTARTDPSLVTPEAARLWRAALLGPLRGRVVALISLTAGEQARPLPGGGAF